MYSYNNKEFSSLKELSKYSGVNEKTITARLRRGLSVEEACKNTDLRCSYMEYNNSKNSIQQICDNENKNPQLIRNRLKYGYSINEALNTPKKISKQGKPIKINGILYGSVSEALRKLNMIDKEHVVRGRLYSGATPEQAFFGD